MCNKKSLYYALAFFRSYDWQRVI